MRASHGTRVFGLLIGSVLLPACVPSAPDGRGEAVSAQRGSLVQIDVAYTRDLAPGAEPRLEAAAHFVRFRAADPAVDRSMVASLLGLGDDDQIALDSCRSEDRVGTEPAPAQGAGAVEVALLDAGTLALRTRSGANATLVAQLEAQHYPDLFPFVSGVIYGKESSPAPMFEPGAQLEIEAGGGEDVGPFLAAAAIPAAFPGLAAHHDAGTGQLELSWNGTLSMQTAPPSASASVLIDVRWAGARPGALRCRAHDDGRFVVLSSLVPGLAAAISASAGAQVSVARSQRAAVEVPSAGTGRLTVTLRDTATLDGAQPR